MKSFTSLSKLLGHYLFGSNFVYEMHVSVSALTVAGRIGDGYCLHALLQAGADVNASNKKGYTAIHYASERNYRDCLDLLLQAGADVNAVDNSGYTALHCAAFRGDFTFVKKLLYAGADVNIKDVETNTALHQATTRNHSKCASILICAGADVNLLSESEKSTLRNGEVECGLSLMDLSREAVRNHLLLVNQPKNLLQTIPQLPLPNVVVEYLLYNVSINDDQVVPT